MGPGPSSSSAGIDEVTQKNTMTNTPQIKNQNWAWNLALLLSFLFLVYLPAKEVFIDKEQSGGYVELLSLLPSGVFYTLLVTLLGSIKRYRCWVAGWAGETL